MEYKISNMIFLIKLYIKEYLQTRDMSEVQIIVMDLSKSFKQAV